MVFLLKKKRVKSIDKNDLNFVVNFGKNGYRSNKKSRIKN